VLPGDGITVAIVTRPQNNVLLLEARDLTHLHGLAAVGGKVALLQVADILGRLWKAEDKKLLAGLKIAQL